jgi:hypothetical protein
MAQVVEETKTYIKDRKEGRQTSLRVGSNKVNSAFLDGFDWNRIITIAGLSGCLEENTTIHVNRGKRSSSRRYTIKDLYTKFHTEWNKDIKTNIRVYKEDQDVFGYNQILDVVDSGEKPVFKIRTHSGFEIISTADHKFLTMPKIKDESLFKTLGMLEVGDSIVVRKKRTNKKKQHKYRKSFTGQFKYYANAREKIIEKKYKYFECLEQRVVYDAHLNGFSDIKEFLKQCCAPNTFIFSDSNMEIHHKDGNTLNNNIDNLELLSKLDHAKEHLRLNNNMYTAELDKIVSIEYLGIKHTYDICCLYPYNNFIANNFVVHNSGKSTILRQWIKEMIELNPIEEFDVLSFQFEMLGVDEAARDVSSKLHKSVKEIYSAGTKLTDTEHKKVESVLDTLKDYPIYVVDNLATVNEIKDTILYYVSTNELAIRKRGLVVSIDHSLLCKPNGDRTDEKQILDDLMKMLVELKKILVADGVKAMFFVLSQLNRNIESTERITNPKLHYPNKGDLFGASSVYYSSDYVMILHRPCLIEGLGNWYGPARKNYPNGLPVFNPNVATQSMIYLHIIKERFGANKIVPMLDELQHSKITEYQTTN